VSKGTPISKKQIANKKTCEIIAKSYDKDPRTLTPGMNEYIHQMKLIIRFSQQYGFGLELSFLTHL